MVSKNAYMGKAAPSDVESFQSFPWLLPDFTILFIYYVHNISQCFSEKQNQLDMCVYIYIYRKELAHTIMEAEFRPAKLQSITRPK